MTTTPYTPPITARIAVLVILGVILGAFMESLAGTALAFARLDMMGDIYTTQDEFAWLDFPYVAAKIVGFMLVPWFFARIRPVTCLRNAIFLMAVMCFVMVFLPDFRLMSMCRIVQGLAGGVILVAGQAIFFQRFEFRWQPLLQACYAIGCMVITTSMASAIQGWVVDDMSWEWIFIVSALIGMVAALLLNAVVPLSILKASGEKRLDVASLTVFTVATFCLVYVGQEGTRWNWFDEQHIVVLAAVGISAMALFIVMQVCRRQVPTLVNLEVFNYPNFCIGFVVSFAAGIVLLGSTWLIPNYSLSVLNYSATLAGTMLIPGGLFFIFGLFIVAFLIMRFNVPIMLNIPFGITFLIIGMMLLSNSTIESGTPTMLGALMIRGLGMGFLFLAMALFALGALKGSTNTQGVALFTIHRQFGGVFGVAMLQRYIDRQKALNKMVVSSHFNDGGTEWAYRLQTIGDSLYVAGMEKGDAAKAAMALVSRSMESQVSVLSYNEGFIAVAMVFAVAAPIIVCIKVWLARRHRTGI